MLWWEGVGSGVSSSVLVLVVAFFFFVLFSFSVLLLLCPRCVGMGTSYFNSHFTWLMFHVQT